MRFSRLKIANFRNFHKLDVRLGPDLVVVGENGVGKSNLIYALRLLIDPTLPDSARQLKEEDFWDDLERPLRSKDKIVISAELVDFDEDPDQLAILSDHMVSTDPITARLTYVFQKAEDVEGDPKKSQTTNSFATGEIDLTTSLATACDPKFRLLFCLLSATLRTTSQTGAARPSGHF